LIFSLPVLECRNKIPRRRYKKNLFVIFFYVGICCVMCYHVHMNKKLTILLIEDEPLEAQEIVTCIEATEEVQLVGVTNNTNKAMEYVTAFQPDAIILDLELHKGYGNGLAFLDELKNAEVSTYVLVTTHNISHVTHDSARQMGADFIMLKSQEDYSAKGVIAFLCSLKNVIHNNKKPARVGADPETELKRRQTLAGKILTELNLIGIPSNAVGRNYLADSIILLTEDRREKIYKTLAEKYGKTEASIERAMQNSISRAWKTSHIDDLEKYYTARIYSTRGMPTVMEFIHFYAEKVGKLT